jgi:hypothetical protein
MMYQVEMNPLEQLSTDKICTNLPKKIIEADPSLSLFPEAGPTWKVKVKPVHIRKRRHSQGGFNRLSVIHPGNHPDFVESGNLANPMPTDTWL